MIKQRILKFIFLSISLLIGNNLSIAQTTTTDKGNAPAQRQRGIQYVEDASNANTDTRTIQGYSIGVDLVGLVMYAVGDYGQFEGNVRMNIKEKYFPTIEVGYGLCNSTNEETNLHYKTQAPYFRIGCDINFCKDKASKNRIFGGLRYAFTSNKYDLSAPDLIDPYWGQSVPFNYSNIKNTASWIELVFGLEAKIWKNFHMGWTARYCKRMRQTADAMGQAWYVPGFGKNDTHNFSGTFNLVFDI